MEAFFDNLTEWLRNGKTANYLGAAVIFVVGFFLARLVSKRIAVPRFGAQENLILRRISSYVIYGVTVAWVLKTLGVDVSVVLGAAGILTVAIGFAAQTSASNLISGLFLMFERPFVLGDVIEVAGTTGEVVSVDLLSVKLRTFDNLQVRIPNESMLKSNLKNMSAYPIRRYDLKIGVAYKEDLARVRRVLLATAERNVVCLHEPAPLLIFLGFGESSVDLQLSAWAAREDFLELRNTLSEQVKVALDQEGIEIPFPQRTLHFDAAQDSAPASIRTRE